MLWSTTAAGRRFLHALTRWLQMRRAIRLVWESGPIWTAAGSLLLVLQGLLPLLALYLMKLIVDAVAAALRAPDRGAAFHHVLVVIGLAAGVAVLTAVLDALASLVGEIQSQIVTDHLQDLMHGKTIEVDLEYYENPGYYDALHRAQQEAPYRPARIVRGLVQLGQSAVSLIGIAALLVSLHWLVLVVLLAAAIPGIIGRLRYSNVLYQWQRKQTLIERNSDYCHQILTQPYCAKELRLFSLGSVFRGRYSDLRRRIRAERIRIVARRSLMDLGTQVAAVLPIFAVYAYVTDRTVAGVITLGSLVMYYGALQRGQSYLKSLLAGLVGLHEDSLFLANLYEFLDLRPKVRVPAHPRRVSVPIQAGIRLEHVSFSYPGTPRKAIEDISLTIRPGEVIALVGENGSGKTTLVKLLCRLYDVDRGSIRIDGVDLREFDPTELRSQISVVFQDYVGYHLTARENIWVGNVALPLDDERIITAARMAGADEVIRGLEQGYETVLGRWIENGEQISIGEWQKVALARAFVRDAQIVILDEPTSALDARAEHELFQRFKQLVRGRTAILISHRLSSVQMADRIYVLADGRIAECGTHQELLSRRGAYADLFEMQAQQYQTVRSAA